MNAMKAFHLLPILLVTLHLALAQSAYSKAPTPEACNTAPARLEGGALHVLRVEALVSLPTDGTYLDEGYGQGEFDTVRLLEVVRSPLRWKPGQVFKIHPFPGRHSGQEDFAPEHLIPGKRYYIVYTYHLDREPHGDGDANLIGLTRCGVHEDTQASKTKLIQALSR